MVMSHYAPNQDLSAEQRAQKKQLKSLLKYQTRVRKLQVRLQQATQRREWELMERTRVELDALLTAPPTTTVQDQTPMENHGRTAPSQTSHDCVAEKRFIHQVYLTLQQKLKETDARETDDSVPCSHAKPTTENIDSSLSEHFETAVSIDELTNEQATSSSSELLAPPSSTRQKAYWHDPNHFQSYHQRALRRQAREHRTATARVLLNHMTKGTQTLDMFHNHTALRGYLQHKFQERAMLVVTALHRLCHEPICHRNGAATDFRTGAEGVPTVNNHISQETCQSSTLEDQAEHIPTTTFSPLFVTAQCQSRIQKRIREIRSVASIGCGPGCDAVGIAAFLSSFQSAPSPASKDCTLLDRIVLLDWALPQWHSLLTSLSDILLHNGFPAAMRGCKIVREVEMAVCDVRSPLLAEDAWPSASVSPMDNLECYQLLTKKYSAQNPSPPYDAATTAVNAEAPAVSAWAVDMFVVSYLLSETRHKWFHFIDDIVKMSAPGTLFLLTDPTAWQLHLLQNRCGDLVHWIWLDSSMHHPELQLLENRIGPAVLMGIKNWLKNERFTQKKY
jgi:hypothetical protein